MRCVRCQQELPPRADRCPRCFAPNPANRGAPETGSGPDLPDDPRSPVPPPLEISLASDPPPPDRERPASSRRPPAPDVDRSPAWAMDGPAFAGDEQPRPAAPGPIDPHDAVTDPPSLPPPPRVPVPALCAAWLVDLAAVCLLEVLFVGLARLVVGRSALSPLGQQSVESWADGLLFARGLPALWLALGAALCVAYGWLSVALWGRTLGQRLARFRLLRPDASGGTEPADALLSLLHALLGLASFGGALAGFLWALLDPKRQTLHDKVCGVAPTPDP